MRVPLLLTIEERRSALWQKLEAHLEARLSDLRKQNDGNWSDVDTANLRGRIAEVRLMIALGIDPAKEQSRP